LIYQAGFNPNVLPLGSGTCDVNPTAPCHVFWAGGTKQYTSVILIATGLTFLGQSIVFISIGSLADFGNWNPWVVRGFSVLSYAFEFGFLGVTTAAKWRIAMALYILSSKSLALMFNPNRNTRTVLLCSSSLHCLNLFKTSRRHPKIRNQLLTFVCTGITFWASYVFFNAIFPKLSHDLPEVRTAREELLRGNINAEEFEFRCSMARSKIMNLSYGWNNIGFIVCCALSVAALLGIGADSSVEKNNWGYSVCVAVCTGFWVILAIPWFLWEKKRPGPKLPKGDNYLTFGFKQTYFTFKEAWTLKQTFFYLIAFFLLADGLGTQLTLVAIAQTQVVAFSATMNTYLIMAQGGAAAVGVFGAYYIQRYFNLRTKTVLQWTNFFCLLTALWGMVGIWTTKFGFHNLWEFWAFAGWFGISFGPQFSYGQAFMGELVPRGREYMFFSLLGIVSKGSSWIGPIVSSAIVSANGNQWTAFPFVVALMLVPFVGIFFISEHKSRQECAEYLSKEATKLRKVRDDKSPEHAVFDEKALEAPEVKF
jgi:MFS-type transporter involved in bile tolerance (Atg22 family)